MLARLALNSQQKPCVCMCINNMLNLMYSNGHIRVIGIVYIHRILTFCYFLDPSERMDLYEPLLLWYLCTSEMTAVFPVLQCQHILQMLLSQLYCYGEILYCSFEPVAGSKEISKRIREKTSIVSTREKFSVNIFPLSYRSFSFSLLHESDFFSVPFLHCQQGHHWAFIAAYIYWHKNVFIKCIIIDQVRKWKIKKLKMELRKREGSIQYGVSIQLVFIRLPKLACVWRIHVFCIFFPRVLQLF